jgi:predicted TIM-barrel fold metal-dependent hydrolase
LKLGATLSLALFAHFLLAGQPSQRAVAPDKPVAALVPYIDLHTHLDPPDVDSAIQSAIQGMPEENLAKAVFMPSPFVNESPGRFDAELLAPIARKYPGKIAFLAGGGTLNPMIQQAVLSGDAGPEVQRKFKERAEEILRLGAKGFGEMTAEHFPSSTPYEYAPADHPLFLLLADVAAEHDVPISLHMEAVPRDMPLPSELKSPPNPPRLRANIATFERLLAHNPRAKIVWAHLGWDNTGQRTAELCRRLLQAHPNLYMELKIDPISVGKNSPLANGATGAIKPEWLKLIQDFSDRFVMGTDQHYPMPKAGPQRWQADVLLLNQIPGEARRKIAAENAVRIYHLK